MLTFITIIFTLLLLTCLTTPSFWYNIFHYHCWYEKDETEQSNDNNNDETESENKTEKEKNTQSTIGFILFQIVRIIILITIPIIMILLTNDHNIFESNTSLCVCLLSFEFFIALFSIVIINNFESIRTTNKIKNLIIDCTAKALIWSILLTITMIDGRNFNHLEIPTTLVETSGLSSQTNTFSLDSNALEILIDNTFTTYYSNNTFLCKADDNTSETLDSNLIFIVPNAGEVSYIENKITSTPENCRHIGLVIDDSGNVYEAYAHLTKKGSFLGNYCIDNYVFYNVKYGITEKNAQYYSEFPDWAK